MTNILCGSKPYNNINFNNLIDNNFDNIYRCNMCINTQNYGTKISTIQFLNIHVYKNYKSNLLLNDWINFYEKTCKIETIKDFYNYINIENKTKYLYLNNNNTYEINKLLKMLNIKIDIIKQSRVGLGAIIHLLLLGKNIFIIGFGIDKYDLNNSYYYKLDTLSECHDPEKEKEVIIQLHNRNYIDATFSCLEDFALPIIQCKIIKPKIESILYLLKTYGICIMKNFYFQEEINNAINEFNKVFKENESKIEILDKEDCSNDERIFHAEKYSSYLKKIFSDNELFNNIAIKYTNKRLNKKTLINKVVYENGKIKNSGAGWHRDNHDCQFKVLMYLSDVNEKNGPFQFITNSSKKYIGYPPPRTENYNTRFHDKTIENLIEKNENCKIYDLIGEKGTVIIVDTTYIHRGKIIEEGERNAITEYFI